MIEANTIAPERIGRETMAAKKGKRGLASASAETRLRVARAGGEAPHTKRGLQAASSLTRQRVASLGGKSSRS